LSQQSREYPEYTLGYTEGERRRLVTGSRFYGAFTERLFHAAGLLPGMSVLDARVPGYEAEYGRRGWQMFPTIGQVYVNRWAWDELGWRPRYDFDAGERETARGAASRAVGSKAYHARSFPDGPYPVE
jgi:hypothetical protein